MKKKQTSRSVTAPRGFRAAGGAFAIKPSGQPDMALIAADALCTAAAVFTTNQMPGAPVIVSKRHVRSGRARAIICNAGVSNVCTGQQGLRNAEMMCRLTAEGLGDGCQTRQVLVSSTGVIGKPLPMDKIETGVKTLCHRLSRGEQADKDAARAILTTDLVTKTALRRIKLAGETVTIGGVAKGSGMIAPHMATMLVFITTDAVIHAAPLKAALKHAVSQSFNRINVDDDTSTSDSVQILASALAGHRRICSSNEKNKAYQTFRDALTDLCKDLAYQIVKDGEGAEKVFRVVVRGAANQRDADRIGRTVTASPLVKTAVHGGDPNWGRLAMAVGRSGAKVKPERVGVGVGKLVICRAGESTKLTPAKTRELDRLMAQKEITITIDLGLGDGACQWLGCDLSREYIRINADYTT